MSAPVELSHMGLWTRLKPVRDRSRTGTGEALPDREQSHADRLRADGGEQGDRDEGAAGDGTDAEDEEDETSPLNDGEDEVGEATADETDATGTARDRAEDAESGVDTSNVEVTEAGEAEPAEPKWDRIDPDDIPEFEIRADRPAGVGESTGDSSPGDPAPDSTADERGTASTNHQNTDPTAGRPNTARSPGRSRLKQGGTEGYIVALEICARLPDDVRLPDEAADIVPAAVEAELEQDIRAFATAEFETPTPSVETLSFVEADGEIWLRLRLGVSPEAFADLDPDEIREHALQQLEGLF